MKIKLIAPHEQSGDSISSAETFKIQKVNLSLLAALVPSEYTVKIVDEAFAPDDINEEVNLVGITVITDLALRAYQIADTYRRHGVKVVMGGIHPTILPNEALQHADAVVIGEAEEVWPRLLSDAALRKLQKIYYANTITNLNGMPIPRRDLYPKPLFRGYTPLAFGIETSRGCPYDCEFCSIGSVMGRQYRFRPISEVIAEIESIESPNIFIVDDAIALNRQKAKELFTEMTPFHLKWAGQGHVSLAEDLELLKLMRHSGCVGLLVGFESIQNEVQNEMKKIKNLKIDFSEAVHRFHNEGIAILGAFIFGFDHENKDVFDQTFEFIAKCRLDGAQLRILTPFPGTRLYSRLLKEGRLYESNWWLQGYTHERLLFQPKGMTADELIEGFIRLNRQTYSSGSIINRFFGIKPWKRKFFDSLVYTGLNLATRKRYFNSLINLKPNIGTHALLEKEHESINHHA